MRDLTRDGVDGIEAFGEADLHQRRAQPPEKCPRRGRRRGSGQHKIGLFGQHLLRLAMIDGDMHRLPPEKGIARGARQERDGRDPLGRDKLEQELVRAQIYRHDVPRLGRRRHGATQRERHGDGEDAPAGHQILALIPAKKPRLGARKPVGFW